MATPKFDLVKTCKYSKKEKAILLSIVNRKASKKNSKK